MDIARKQNEILYKKIAVSLEDLTLARRAARRLLEGDWDFGPTRGAADYWDRAAFTCALVMSYGRVFKKGNGLPLFPDDLLTYDTQDRVQHEELIRLRDKQYAHSDGETHEVRISPAPVAAVHKFPNYSIPRVQLERIASMIEKVIGNIEARQSEIHTALLRA